MPIKQIQPSQKLQQKYFGPFKILGWVGPLTVKLAAGAEPSTPGFSYQPTEEIHGGQYHSIDSSWPKMVYLRTVVLGLRASMQAKIDADTEPRTWRESDDDDRGAKLLPHPHTQV
eukprot:COSAG04_NODE_4800_length_1887_cov_48.002796_2_plen_115_part_00